MALYEAEISGEARDFGWSEEAGITATIGVPGRAITIQLPPEVATRLKAEQIATGRRPRLHATLSVDLEQS